MLAVTLLLGAMSLTASAQVRTFATRAEMSIRNNAAIDAGAMPASEPLTLTFRLAPSALQASQLDQLLRAQTDVSSPEYHRWLTPESFATQFAPTVEQISSLSTWLTAQGLSVGGISPSRTRMTVTGTAGQVQAVLSVSLRRMSISGQMFYGNITSPSLPASLGQLISSVSGLDNLPVSSLAEMRLGTSSGNVPLAKPRTLTRTEAGGSSSPAAGSEDTTDILSPLSDAVDANGFSVLTLSSEACSDQVAESDVAAFRAVLQQAQAQGITVLSSSGCARPDSSTSFPSGLAAVTAVNLSPGQVADAADDGIDVRPSWQVAAGLPVDAVRHEPDLTSPSLTAFAQTVATLNTQIGDRIGNLNSTLYALAKTPGLFRQSDIVSSPAGTASAAGNWEPSTGLGVISLATLLKVYPRGVSSTQVSLVSSSYAINYGDTFTLTAKVLPNSYGSTGPTGTVTFTSSSQGVLGSSSVDSSGTATLTPDVLPVGVYSVTATYSGDANYSGSNSTSKVTITISIVNASLIATISPQLNVPYGATATVTATVTLPGSSAAPSGPVSAQIEAVTGAFYSATLSPNQGGNSATANIVVSPPSPGTYTVQVTCQGNSNFQCQTPVNLRIMVVKGYTNTTVSASPSAPQAGQPISLVATVANAGNGTGTYTFTGSVSFFDSGKLLATTPVATNQATTTVTLSGNRTHNIIAVYTGDSNWNTSTSGAVAVSPTILPDALTVSSSVTSSSSLAGENIIFTGSVVTDITYGTGPTGTISFFDTFNGAVVQLGNATTLVANGPTASIALFTTTGLLPGLHRIYAQYSGDDNYASATSPVMQLSLADFSVSMTPTSLTLAQGKSQQITVFVGNSGGFSGTVSLGCTPPSSSEATCTFAPSTVTGGGATTLTITTVTAQASSRPTPGQRAGLWTAAAGTTLTGFVLLLVPGGRRRLPSLLAVLFAIALSANVGCGIGVTGTSSSASSGSGSDSGSGSGSSGDSGTPLGTQNYTITAAATDGVNTIRHTYQYQVTVQ